MLKVKTLQRQYYQAASLLFIVTININNYLNRPFLLKYDFKTPEDSMYPLNAVIESHVSF